VEEGEEIPMMNAANINHSMLQMLSLDVADTCWVLQTLNFDVADVEFRCCRHVMSGFVSRRRGGELLMLDVARSPGRNTIAI
jgi:hypothetical protein